MTIKQQGGIFGRNPEFNSLAVDGDTLIVDAQNNRVGVGLNNPIAPFHVKSSGDIARFQGSDAQILIDNNTSNTISITSLGTGDSIVFGTNGTPRLTIGPTGELTVDNGNMVFPAGNGIDFSATSGTGTSELFSDYEEGVYTPTLTPAGSGASGTITLNSSYDKLAYTKIGRLVTVTGAVIVSSVSSPAGTRVDISLPFTGGDTSDISERCCGLVLPKNLGSVGNAAIRVNGPSATTGSLVTISSGTQSDIAATDFSGDEELQFTFSYIAA